MSNFSNLISANELVKRWNKTDVLDLITYFKEGLIPLNPDGKPLKCPSICHEYYYCHGPSERLSSEKGFEYLKQRMNEIVQDDELVESWKYFYWPNPLEMNYVDWEIYGGPEYSQEFENIGEDIHNKIRELIRDKIKTSFFSSKEVEKYENDNGLIKDKCSKSNNENELLMKPFPTPEGTNWEDVHIHLIETGKVRIKIKEMSRTMTYEQMGFANLKNMKPIIPWFIFQIFIKDESIDWFSTLPLKDKSSLKQIIKRLNRILKDFFCIENNPINYVRRLKSYKADFSMTYDKRLEDYLSKVKKGEFELNQVG